MNFWLRHRLLLLSLSALFVTLLLCSLAIFWQVQSDLRNDGRQRVRFGVEQLDQQIRYVETFVSQELQDAPTALKTACASYSYGWRASPTCVISSLPVMA